MGRQKQHKPRHRDARPEWFGTAFATSGMHHLDVRRSGNGILITASPAEVDDRPAMWQIRLRNDDDGRGLRELGTALATGRTYGLLLGEDSRDGGLLFMPDRPNQGLGTLTRVSQPTGPSGETRIERRATRPMALWAEAGENLLRIVKLLGPELPTTVDVEECLPCPGCGRPVYESSCSSIIVGPLPVFGLCEMCAGGGTLRALRASGDVATVPEQLAVLNAAAAAMA